MKRITALMVLVLTCALFFSETRAQVGEPLDTLTKVNGWRLISYAPGVYHAGTRFDNTSAYHGKFSQWFWVERLSPDVANDREYYAIFKKNLPKRIKRSDYLQYSYNYCHSLPNLGVESPLIDIAFGNNNIQAQFKNIVNIQRDNWTMYPINTSDIKLDSIDCVYLRISGNFKNTYIQVDYLVFADMPLGGITSVIDDFEDSTIVDVEKSPELPTGFALSQNYPNPFNPTTNFKFQISNFNFVSLKVFDVLGREIKTIVEKEFFPGEYTIPFNGSNLASGTYFYQINVGHGQFVQTKKMVLVK